MWVGAHCIGCRLCEKACPQKGLRLDETGQHRDLAKCTACAACGDACPTGATEVKGEMQTVDALCRELLKDRAYFEESGGGITVSGGEALAQPEAVAELLSRLRAEGVPTALDSTLFAPKQALDTVLPQVDLLLLDLKLMDDGLHQKWTGVSNALILENAKYLAQRMRRGENPTRLWIRTPIIPGATDTRDNVTAIARFIAAELADVFERWELCTFNNLCQDKYARLGQDWMFAKSPLMGAAEMDALLAAARAPLGNLDKISWTGAVRIEETIA
jgi:pyruvate formate lyase activating enzyme